MKNYKHMETIIIVMLMLLVVVMLLIIFILIIMRIMKIKSICVSVIIRTKNKKRMIFHTTCVCVNMCFCLRYREKIEYSRCVKSIITNNPFMLSAFLSPKYTPFINS